LLKIVNAQRPTSNSQAECVRRLFVGPRHYHCSQAASMANGQMDNASETDSRIAAFKAAALVLLVLPLIVALGVIALGLATYAGIVSGLGDILRGEASWPALILFLAWVLAVVFGVLAFAMRFVRRST
jgi:hypothetical protein